MIQSLVARTVLGDHGCQCLPDVYLSVTELRQFFLSACMDVARLDRCRWIGRLVIASTVLPASRTTACARGATSRRWVSPFRSLSMSKYLCVADNEEHDRPLRGLALLPSSQVPDVTMKPTITVISENEFIVLSWTGTSTLGVFISGDGDPVRGTLEWPSYHEAVCEWHLVLCVCCGRIDRLLSLPSLCIELSNICTPRRRCRMGRL